MNGRARVTVSQVHELWFGPDDPVRAASAVVRLGDGWLIAQDDATDGAWWRPRSQRVDRVRLLPPREGHETFSEAEGTKTLKPDLEAACVVPVDGGEAVLLLGSGSLRNRTHGALVQLRDGRPSVAARDLTLLYRRSAGAMGLAEAQVNFEGACVVGDRLRWFQRGNARAGVPSMSVDLDVAAVVAASIGGLDPADVPIGQVRRYDLGVFEGWPLAITDAVVLPDGTVCVSATAEDAPDAVADGPIAGSVLALLDDDAEPVVVPLPAEVASHKVEGLAVARATPDRVELLAVTDQDEPTTPSIAVVLQLQSSAPLAT